jgi:hypothetical protein
MPSALEFDLHQTHPSAFSGIACNQLAMLWRNKPMVRSWNTTLKGIFFIGRTSFWPVFENRQTPRFTAVERTDTLALMDVASCHLMLGGTDF